MLSQSRCLASNRTEKIHFFGTRTQGGQWKSQITTFLEMSHEIQHPRKGETRQRGSREGKGGSSSAYPFCLARRSAQHVRGYCTHHL